MSRSIPNFNASFGGWLTWTRELAGVSQAALAARIGTSQESVRKWERGVACPSLYNAVMVCDALGASLEDLMASTREVTR